MTTPVSRRALLGAAALLPLATPALAFPDQPIRIVVPWNAGGATDVVTRALAAAMAPVVGQPVVVDNRPGANGAVGAQFVAQARPDGHTLFVASAETHAVNPLVYQRLAYDPMADFLPITLFADGPFALVVRSGLGTDTLDAFLALARSRPGALTYASWGIGSTSHLAAARVIQAAGVDMLHVPYTGAAPAYTALVAAQVDAMFMNAGPAESLSRDGRVKVLGIGSSTRVPLLPAVPTLREQGMQLDAANWFGLVGPARMPAAAATRIAEASAEALRSPAAQEVFRTQGILPVTGTPDQARAFITADRERWAAVIRPLNLRLD
ncbi:tripartite tricarboxylate transporter substrate binding protein [Falsiroseomonas stagni]|uniref:Tripartite-type tricarboxylate transporter, receptor component TctC n=1 Tax=Falsiroseomonas stagni DSM 19981 TaxID=1123062 RepID=A0A1I4BEJ9_9PROT|nr:tripartite tricarboxylate transporter substrate binding protein [Falsiroseomonas stagni]SFK66883.1 Tripartite-type tricarboxylate transporter, receptor component TctC [Falsiroseomonas stagni DSM 19981]